MHEITIARNIFEIVNESVPKENLTEVEFIIISAGFFSNILTESLISCFDVLKEGTDISGARIIINIAPYSLSCPDCGYFTQTKDFIFSCPVCSQTHINISGGDELIISEIVMRTRSENEYYYSRT